MRPLLSSRVGPFWRMSTQPRHLTKSSRLVPNRPKSFFLCGLGIEPSKAIVLTTTPCVCVVQKHSHYTVNMCSPPGILSFVHLYRFAGGGKKVHRSLCLQPKELCANYFWSLNGV